MENEVTQYLEEDHRRLERALERATADPGKIDGAAYAEFRGGLLRHIGMEEKILMPAAREALHGRSLPAFEQMHLDHGALAALLVPAPAPAIVEAIRAILARHNTIEEGPRGVYCECEALPGFDSSVVLDRLKTAPQVAMAPHADSPAVWDSLRAALQRAGYDFEV